MLERLAHVREVSLPYRDAEATSQRTQSFRSDGDDEQKKTILPALDLTPLRAA